MKVECGYGFVRAKRGNITPFDAPDAVDTYAAQINPAGVIAGDYLDAGYVSHGYVRAPDGKITPFDAPGAGTGAGQGTLPAGINRFGAIEGDYVDAGNVSYGFVRAPSGTIYTFDAPGADLTPGDNGGTYPQTINLFGAITGYYRDANNVYHGFVREASGRLREFQAPGADTTPGATTARSHRE